MPQISIIVPVYKVEKYLNRCLDSIIAQTFTDWECILVDDGSPDNCGKICDEYAKKDNRFIVIHQKNGGLSAARNSGIDWAFANSNSEWLAFIDSDDWVHKRFLEFLHKAAVQENVKISMSSLKEVIEFCEDDEKYFHCVTKEPEEVYANEEGVYAYACGRLYRKELFKVIRYPEGKNWEDVYTTYKVLFKCKSVAIVDSDLYYYFRHTDSITRSDWSLKKCEDELGAHEASLSFLKQNKYHSCYNLEMIPYARYLYRHYVAISQSTDIPTKTKKTYCRNIKKKLRRAIKCNSKFKKNYFSEDKYVYEIVYPKLMWIYWVATAIIIKIKARILSILKR